MAVAPIAAAAAKSWLAPAIAGAATVGGQALASRAANKATKAQERATQDALKYERDREASMKAERDAAREEYRQAWMAWYDRVGDAGVKRYGVPRGVFLPPKSKSGAVPLAGGGTPSAGLPPATPPPQASAQRRTLGSLAEPAIGSASMLNQAAMMQGMQPQKPRTLGSADGWEDWSTYGVS